MHMQFIPLLYSQDSATTQIRLGLHRVAEADSGLGDADAISMGINSWVAHHAPLICWLLVSGNEQQLIVYVRDFVCVFVNRIAFKDIQRLVGGGLVTTAFSFFLGQLSVPHLTLVCLSLW